MINELPNKRIEILKINTSKMKKLKFSKIISESPVINDGMSLIKKKILRINNKMIEYLNIDDKIFFSIKK